MMRLEASCACRTSDRLRSVKSSSWPGCSRWRWRSRSRICAFGFLHVVAVAHLDRDRADARAAWPAFRRARGCARWRSASGSTSSWSWPDQALALALEHADDGERHLADADHLADRIGVAEQVASRRSAPSSATLAAPAMSAGVEAAAGSDDPVAHLEVFRRHAVEHRRPVVVAGDDLAGAAQAAGAAACTPAISRWIGVGVVLGKRWCASPRPCARRRRSPSPACRMMRLEPRLLICSSTRACAPAPTAIMVITAATPMMMPSMVRMRAQLVDAQRAQRDADAGEQRHEGHAAASRAPSSIACGVGRAPRPRWSSTTMRRRGS